MKQRNKLQICDMTHNYWIFILRIENYLQKD